MKKYLKIMLVLVVALSMMCTFALAASDNPFVIEGQRDSAGTVTNVVNNVGYIIIRTVQTVGYVIAVVMVLVLGIQWLIGTPAKKQELKGKMWNVLIGAILIIAGVTILGFINEAVNNTKGNMTADGNDAAIADTTEEN